MHNLAEYTHAAPPSLEEALRLSRAAAFADGLLVPIAPWQRRRHGIPHPIRFSAAAWQQLVTFTGPLGGRRSAADHAVALERALARVAQAVHDCASWLTHAPISLSWPSRFPLYPRIKDEVQIVVLQTLDEEQTPTLTVLTEREAPSRPT